MTQKRKVDEVSDNLNIDTEVPFEQYSLRERLVIAWYMLLGRKIVFRNVVNQKAKELVDQALLEWGLK